MDEKMALPEELRVLRERVAEQARQLEEAKGELDAFLYSASHDLRAPLITIDSLAQLAVEGHGEALGADGLRFLTGIQNASRTMTRLVDELLRLSRASRAEVTLVSLDLSELASEVFEELRRREPEREVTFELGEVPAVLGDGTLLKQALAHLISNALKFTRSRERAVIRFGGERLGAEVACQLSDNGLGFDMKHRDRLFRPFEKLHSSVKLSGTGLGLAIVERIVRRHGGRVWAEGEEGKGATFGFAVRAAAEGEP
ncbi:MAG: two-component sensor histidine kinase [Candidatus Wallbacteria bacterium]|nr:two-component sensor histidine kinase [Candidatus Wallbacteria bacterium]